MSSAAESLRRSRWRWLWPYVRRQMPALCAVLVLAIAASALSIALPYLSKLIIDRGLIGRNFPLLLKLCGGVVGLAGLSILIGGVSRWIYVKASAGILFALREEVYSHLLSLSPGFYRNRATGDLVTRLDGDVAEIQRFSTDTLLSFVNGLLLLTGTAVIMVAMSWQLALVAAAVLPVQLAVRRWARHAIAGRTRSIREQASGIAQFLFETLSSVKAVQSAVAERREVRRLHGLNRDYLTRLLSLQLVSYAVGSVSGLLSHIATAAVFVYGGFRVIEGSLTVGTLVAFVAYMARGTGSAVSLLNLYMAYQRTSVSLERVEELLGAEEMDADAGHGTRARRISVDNGALSFRGVSLGRRVCGRALLTDCSLEIPAGRKVVIHGASGTGKSTLIDAMRRFAPLDAGHILLGGIDVHEYEPAVLRREIEVLISEPVIFRASILDNIRYGNFDATPESVLNAAGRAGVDEIVAALPDGLETILGGGGQGLSTGQRQRVAIARALLRRPSVLVLDEAMTNLDAGASHALQRVIDEQFAGCTRIVISHAPALVPGADLVVEMRDGRLIQAPRVLRA